MIINDRIYGEILISDPVIVDLIHTKPFQRLKHISQDGATHFLQPIRNVTRFEHCIGTWFLSKKFNRPIEEQVASLLHDLPHTAFSHVIDFVVENKNHEYHDQFIKDIIIKSEIPEILKKHKISLTKILNKNNFPLLNNSLPDISVDRWDYYMRDGFNGNLLPKATIDLYVQSIYEINEQFYFTDIKIAHLFALMFVQCSILFWLDPASHGSAFLLSNAIKIALNKKYISKADFFTTDTILLKKLTYANDPEINKLLKRLNPKTKFMYASKNGAEFYGPNKPRYIDPLILHKNKLFKLTDLNPELLEYFENFKNQYKVLGVKGYSS